MNFVRVLSMTELRLLTKSRFKIGCECPTKLFYTSKRGEYANRNLQDPFLSALAEGGFQVGQLAKLYYPGGTDVKSLGLEESLLHTEQLLTQTNCVIYEAAIRFEKLFLRADIVKKEGSLIELIEVKAKSFDSHEESPFTRRRDGAIASKWRPYLLDIAFQTYVFEKAFPEFTVIPFLLLADKHAPCLSDGLNQKFLIQKSKDGVCVRGPDSLSDEELSSRILRKVNVREYVQKILSDSSERIIRDQSFSETVAHFAEAYSKDVKIKSRLGSKCAACEFVTTADEESEGLKSGFRQCWSTELGWQDADFEKPSVLELWNFRRKDDLIEAGIFHLSEVTEEHIQPKSDARAGWSTTERQMLQVSTPIGGKPRILISDIRAEMKKLIYPLHFIDFETTMVAIPFHRDRKPYEGIAFQFSHHQMDADGTVYHVGDYLSTERGYFPNYDFVRHLKEHLGGDQGSIFRYATHENTFLNFIHRQISTDSQPPEDAQELLLFIESITQSGRSSSRKWKGTRCMIDLLDWVKRYYYDPLTRGSNSIKYVLPAILSRSAFLQERYSAPNYGTHCLVRGSHFDQKTWVQWEKGCVKDPYKLLPKLFDDVSDHDMEFLTEDGELRNGAAALTAYARMQFTEMTNAERDALAKGLLRYCELDTLAMVMLFEGWKNWEA